VLTRYKSSIAHATPNDCKHFQEVVVAVMACIAQCSVYNEG
jgi:hypothetical protein